MISSVFFVEANVGSESTPIRYVFHDKNKLQEFIKIMTATGSPFNYNIREEKIVTEDPFVRYCGKPENNY